MPSRYRCPARTLAPALLLATVFLIPAWAADGPTDKSPPAARSTRPEDVLPPEEYEQFRRRLNEAKTPQERDAVRQDRRAAVAGRTASAPPHHARPVEELLTQQERDGFRARMQEAKTPEERAAVRQEERDTIRQRQAEAGS